MSSLTPYQRELHERFKRINKWSDEENTQHRERNKEFYDNFNSEYKTINDTMLRFRDESLDLQTLERLQELTRRFPAEWKADKEKRGKLSGTS